jgi:hypothetical protein
VFWHLERYQSLHPLALIDFHCTVCCKSVASGVSSVIFTVKH